MALTLTSSAFSNNQLIPAVYTCKGYDISPPLAWTDIPDGTKSFALIMDDPDAPVGIWDHWILFNIPANISALSENAVFPSEVVVLKNSWGNESYGGPCPPSGTHRYIFQLYALNTLLDSDQILNKSQLQKAVDSHVIEKSNLIGLFSK